jgi:hypothetical protein
MTRRLPCAGMRSEVAASLFGLRTGDDSIDERVFR